MERDRTKNIERREREGEGRREEGKEGRREGGKEGRREGGKGGGRGRSTTIRLKIQHTRYGHTHAGFDYNGRCLWFCSPRTEYYFDTYV